MTIITNTVILQSKCQIIWEISTNFRGLLRKPELHFLKSISNLEKKQRKVDQTIFLLGSNMLKFLVEKQMKCH